MPALPPVARWEDYQVRLIDKDWSPLAPLGTTYKLRGIRSLYGQFKGELTFALDKRDPYAQFLLERQVHFIQVLRLGRVVFEGFQIKLDREDTIADAERWIEFAFLPLAFLLHWRVGTADAKLDYNGPLDDNFKEIVRQTIGPTAPPTPTSGLVRIMTDFSVQANAGAAPAIVIDASGQIIYEIIQQFAAAHKVDWDIVFDADFHPRFRTWFPRRGTDRTETGPGPDSVRCIFSDEQGNFVKQSYGQDTSDLKTIIYDRLGTIDVNAGPTRITNWLLREGIIDSGDAAEMLVALRNAGLKEWYKLEEFKEQLGKLWQQHFFVGDEITWNSVRLGYGPHDDTVAFMEFEIDEAGFEHLTPTFGKPEPDIRDNLRGGGRGRRRPGYTAPTIWHLFGDAAVLVDPDADNAIGVIGGVNITVTEGANIVTIDGTGPAGAAFVAPAFTFGAANVIGASGDVVHSDSVVALGITCPDANTVFPLPAGPNRWSLTSVGGTITITGAVANTVNFEGVPGATCLWVRDDLDSGAGVISGLHTGVAAEPVMIGADSVDLTATPWVDYGGVSVTKLDVRGNIRLIRALYSADFSLALWGLDGGVAKVHIVDGSAAIDGTGGSAALLDVYNAAVRHHMFDADIANPSFIRGFFEIHDAAGAIGHSFNAVTGAIILNEQRLGMGDVRWEATGLNEGMYLDATQGNAGFGRVPTVTHDVYRATGVVTGLLESGDASDVALRLKHSAQEWRLRTNGVGNNFDIRDVTNARTPFIIFDGAPDSAFRIEVAEVVVNETAADLNFRWESTGNVNALFCDAGLGRIGILDGAPGHTLDVGGDINIITGSGLMINDTATNRHALIGNGVRGVFRALVAADLGGHVHALTFSAVATTAGTAHTHVPGGRTQFTQPGISGNTAGWTTYGSRCDGTNPVRDVNGNIVYLRTFANAADAGNDVNATGEICYIGSSGHWHALTGTSGGCETTAATAAVANHAHNVLPANLTIANEAAHTHDYDKTDTPTQGPT